MTLSRSVAGDEFRRARVECRIQFAIARRAVGFGRETRLALERGPGERREAAEVTRRDLQPAANDLPGESEYWALRSAAASSSVSKVMSPPGEAEPLGELRLAANSPASAGSASARPLTAALPSNAIRVASSVSAVRGGVEGGGGMVERSFGDMDIGGVECAVDRAQHRPDDRDVEVELADLRRAGSGAGVDFDAEDVVRGPAALDVEPRVGRENCRPGVTLVEVALERRLGEDRTHNRRRHALEPGIEVQGQPPPGVPSRDSLAIRPDVRAGGEVELRREIVERARAVESEPGRRQAGRLTR